MAVLLIIPARYASTRYPGKPLVGLTGAHGRVQSLIERSWRTARRAEGVDRVVVATDDARIAEACAAFGAEVVMTSTDCANGTERCAEAYATLTQGNSTAYDVVINLQGDAFLAPPWFISDLIAGLKANPWADMATPALPCDGRALNGFLADRRAGRVGGTTVVFGGDGRGLYFSKEVIPYSAKPYLDTEMTPVWHHVGVYAYRPEALIRYPTWPAGVLETLEGLEQLRFLEQGRAIYCAPVDARGRPFWELNNPEDVAIIEAMMCEMDYA